MTVFASKNYYIEKRDVKICIYGEICLILKCEKMSLYIGSIRM